MNPRFERLDTDDLPNAIRVAPQLISGGLPEGERAFAELKRLGIRTIVSVDGAKPDIEIATRFGMRYVHLPHGYDGISDEHGDRIAKAVKELDGPIYIHCHHGKHRSPAAAAVAAIKLGMLTNEQGLQLLQLAGTNPNYRGLFSAVVDATRRTAEHLASVTCTFPQSAEVLPLTASMVQLDDVLQRLSQRSSNQPALSASTDEIVLRSNATLLREIYTELRRMESVQAMSLPFLNLLEQAEQHCMELERLCNQDSQKAQFDQRFRHQLEKIRENCSACHQRFRDNADRSK